MRLKEIIATIAVLASLAALPILVGWYHNSYVLGQYPEGTRVITLSGMTEGGVWTTERVDGTNYWWKDFKPATIYLNEGEKVVLRLQSTDVHHRFYVPELNVGPIDVEPGHIAVTEFEATKAGTYRYYCTSMCGECHFYMQGWIVITAEGQSPQQPEPIKCEHEFVKPAEDDMIAWGRYLYRKNGCITCHGDNGEGGIVNINYIKGTITAHVSIAENLWLKEKENAETFVEMLKAGVDFDELETQPDIPLFNLVHTQYIAAKDLIQNGKNCAKADPNGPEPPLQMPTWRAILTDRDVDAIIAYLITLYEWEEDEE